MKPASVPASLLIGGRPVPLLMVRHPRARRYLLRLQPDGTARVTIPRGGNQTEARAFVERNRAWLEQQLQRLPARNQKPAVWQPGTLIWFRGEQVRLDLNHHGHLHFAGETITLPATPPADLRPVVENHLRHLGAIELPSRVQACAAQHGLTVNRITVRSQKTRWGSCSRRGTISLNWRLIQTPAHVRDYIILHELAHLRHMNHSARFWAEVARLCPDYALAETWLKTHRNFLR